jgi:hypothetical protein
VNFVNDEEANQQRSRPMREPWTIPEPNTLGLMVVFGLAFLVNRTHFMQASPHATILQRSA